MPRPSKLDAEVTDKIVSAIRAGNYASQAAEYAGISEATYYRWLDDDRPEFREFREAVARASAEAEVEAVAFIRKAMSQDWRAALEYLKRRHPERWQDRSKTELSGRDEQPLEVRLHFVGPEDT